VGWDDTAYGGSISQQPITQDYLTTNTVPVAPDYNYGIVRQVWFGQATTNTNWDVLSNLGTPSQVDFPGNFQSQLYFGDGGGNAVVEMHGELTAPEDGDYTSIPEHGRLAGRQTVNRNFAELQHKLCGTGELPAYSSQCRPNLLHRVGAGGLWLRRRPPCGMG